MVGGGYPPEGGRAGASTRPRAQHNTRAVPRGEPNDQVGRGRGRRRLACRRPTRVAAWDVSGGVQSVQRMVVKRLGPGLRSDRICLRGGASGIQAVRGSCGSEGDNGCSKAWDGLRSVGVAWRGGRRIVRMRRMRLAMIEGRTGIRATQNGWFLPAFHLFQLPSFFFLRASIPERPSAG